MKIELIVDEIEKFSNTGLNHKDALAFLIQSAQAAGKAELIEQAAFTAKYVRGLMRVLKDGAKNPEVKSLDHVTKDLTDNMKKVTAQLKEIASTAESAYLKDFENTYLRLNSESFSNLNSLLADLEWTKIYLNDLKRKKN